MKFTLDYKTWRSGGFDDIYYEHNPGEPEPVEVVGKGDTCLYNDEGYMCCLGQFELQRGFKQSWLEGAGVPEEMYNDKEIKGDPSDPFIKIHEEYDEDGNLVVTVEDSDLSNQLITINDSITMTAKERAEKIKEIMEKAGHELELVNFPK